MSNQILSYTNHSRFETPEVFVEGYGDKVINSEGKEFYDVTSGLWNVNYGYNSELYKDVIEKQVSKLHFYPNHFWSTTDVAEQAATELAKHFGLAGAYFTNGGSDAVVAAINICRHCKAKRDVIGYEKGYHGFDKRIIYVDDFFLIDSINPQTLAVIIEPIMTTEGVISFDYQQLYHIEMLRRQYGFYIIFDETVTGLGRVDVDYSIKPDVIICSKGLSNGLFPVGAVLVSEEILFQMKKKPKVFDFGITMSGHPIGAALVLRSIKLYSQTKEARQKLKTSFEISLDEHNIDYRSYGLVFGIKVDNGREARNILKNNGYLTRDKDNTLIVLPMFTIDIKNYSTFFELIGSCRKEIS